MFVAETENDVTIIKSPVSADQVSRSSVIPCTNSNESISATVSSPILSSTTSISEGLVIQATTSLSLPSLQRKLSSCSDSGGEAQSPNTGKKLRPFTISSLTSSPISSASSPTTIFPNRLNFDEVLFSGNPTSGHLSRANAFQNSSGNKRTSGTKRKYSSIELGNGANSMGFPQLPTFIAQTFAAESSGVLLKPLATTISNSPLNSALSDNTSFITPVQPMLNKQLSRPNSPSTRMSGTATVAPRSRIASIRRESDCSTENEAAHEKLVKSAQQVSLGFEDFCLDDKLFEERKRAKSLTEPISIFTNAFLPQSSSPSPTRGATDATQKQCYSPSTQQVVRSNIPYSPSPSPTPSSPYNRMRSMSPIAVRQISKRRYTGNNNGNNNNSNSNGSGLESDGETCPAPPLPPPPPKRQCGAGSAIVRGAASTLVSSLAHFSYANGNSSTDQSSSSPSIQDIPISLSPCAQGQGSVSSGFASMPDVNSVQKPRLLVDPSLTNPCFNTSLDEEMLMAPDSSSYQSFCSSSINDSTSTTFSSRANTPDVPFTEMDPMLSQSSTTSSRCSSLRNVNADQPSAVPSLDFLPLCRSFSATNSSLRPQNQPSQIDQILRDADEAPLIDNEDEEKVPKEIVCNQIEDDKLST